MLNERGLNECEVDKATAKKKAFASARVCVFQMQVDKWQVNARKGVREQARRRSTTYARKKEKGSMFVCSSCVQGWKKRWREDPPCMSQEEGERACVRYRPANSGRSRNQRSFLLFARIAWLLLLLLGCCRTYEAPPVCPTLVSGVGDASRVVCR